MWSRLWLQCQQLLTSSTFQPKINSAFSKSINFMQSATFTRSICALNFFNPYKLQPSNVLLSFSHGYKVRTSLKKRCPFCYFEKRQGRLYVECKVKPRHKQMQKMGKSKLWSE